MNSAVADNYNPFSLPYLSGLTADITERLLGLKKLSHYYTQRPNQARQPGAPFLEYAVESLKISADCNAATDLSTIPTSGSLLLVSNHPLGGLEGILLAHLLLKVRPDLKVVTNELLCRVPELAELFIGVDVLSGNAAKENAKGLRKAHKHLKQGGALLLFPAGMVSNYELKTQRITDRTWNKMAGQLARRQQATCIPIHIGGRNSALFYLAGMVSTRLRTVLLARELANKQGQTLKIRIGTAVTPQEIASFPSDRAITDYLRVHTELLGAYKSSPTLRQPASDVSPAPCHTLLTQEIAQLSEYELLNHKDFKVFCVPYKKLGSIMGAISVAREITFRAAGEGTGKKHDNDHFDPYYWHLFIWDTQAQKVVGGYRVGKVDEIMAQQGVEGLYSRTLFKYSNTFITNLGNALEMGRSFIIPDYQKRPSMLDLLWRGIGAFINANPQYNTLFGPVSISGEYSHLARSVMADSLLQNYGAEPILMNDIEPLQPLRSDHHLWQPSMLEGITNIKLINKLVSQCDPGKNIPVLLRHYLSLNGKFAGFHVDQEFNNTLAGLVIVDVNNAPKKYLKRYMSR